MKLDAEQHVKVLVDCQALQNIAEAHSSSQPESLPCTAGSHSLEGGRQLEGWSGEACCSEAT